MTTRSVTLEELEQTMIIDQDVTTIEGLIVIRKGHEVTDMVRERLERFNKGVGIKEPIRVLAPRSP
jgi:hypothetical protein